MGKKNGINKQIEEREGTGMTDRKGQRKVHETMVQDITQRILWCDCIPMPYKPKTLPHFQKKLWLSNDY